MPYYTHRKDRAPLEGTEHATLADAKDARREDETIAYLSNNDELWRWQDRELDRFNTGQYIYPPWNNDLASIPNHYAHLALSDPGKIAYTKSAQHGHEDRQTKIRPGRYFTEFFPDLDQDRVRQYAALADTSLTLCWAVTADEIEAVYYASLGGTCMATSTHTWNIAPTRVYGDSDIRIAYTGPIENCTSRAICWPDRKIYSRAWGHLELIEALLAREGYTQGSIVGARVRKIMDGQTYVFPYIDTVRSATDTQDGWIVLDNCGRIPCGNTCGEYTPPNAVPRSTCDHCGDPCGQHEDYCEYCMDHTFSCVDCDNRFADEDGRSTDDGMYCEDCFNNAYFVCGDCGDTTAIGDRHETQYASAYCEDCYSNLSTTCAIEDCCSDPWIEDEDFSARQRRDRTARHVDTLCRECADVFTYCEYCEDYFNADETNDPIVVDGLHYCDARIDAMRENGELAIVVFDPAFAIAQCARTGGEL